MFELAGVGELGRLGFYKLDRCACVLHMYPADPSIIIMLYNISLN